MKNYMQKYVRNRCFNIKTLNNNKRKRYEKACMSKICNANILEQEIKNEQIIFDEILMFTRMYMLSTSIFLIGMGLDIFGHKSITKYFINTGIILYIITFIFFYLFHYSLHVVKNV
jgi:hypothetical protein